MDIHKPKAAHSVREFLIEIGTIICGILIALGLEQGIEALHWRHEVDAERKSLRAEAADNLSAIKHREAQQACVDARLSEVSGIIEGHVKGQPLATTGVRRGTNTQFWIARDREIAVAGQALAHMPHREKLAFSEAFSVYTTWHALVASEADAWSRLAALNKPGLLADADWTGIKSAYWQAVHVNERMRLLAPFAFKVESLGLPIKDLGPSSGYEAAEQRICAPMTANSSA